MDARRGTNTCTRWWVVVLVMLSARLPGLLAWYCSEDNRVTLLEFKSAFVDVAGVFSTWDADSNCCTWRGVHCSESNSAVLQLTLVGDSGNGQQTYRNPRFVGVGAGLVALTSLQQLTIQGLLLDQAIPSEWGDFSSNLQVIIINNANLEDNIPPSLARIPNLKTLDLKHNHLTGSIPPEFCKHQSIENIDVSYNNMDPQPVPWCLRRVNVIYGNEGQNQRPPGIWSASSALSIPSITFKAVSVGVLVWMLL